MVKARCRICGAKVRSRESNLCAACEDDVKMRRIISKNKKNDLIDDPWEDTM